MSTVVAYRGKILTCLAGGSGALAYFEDGVLVVGADGRILSVGSYEALLSGQQRGAPSRSRVGPLLDVRPGLICPGFVDAHVHYPQTRIIGSASGELLAWLERSVFPEEARFGDEAYARAVASEFTQQLLSMGTTTAAVFSSSHATATDVLFEALANSGIRALVGLTLMDQACPDALRQQPDEAIAACRELAGRWHGHDGGRLAMAITPRFALSCSRGLMERAARLAAERGLLVQTHVSEHPDEGVQTLAAHPYGKDYLDVYDKVGLLTPRTLLAHAIHLSSAEWDRIAERGARVVHCPDSNFFLGSGRMRLGEARSRGVPVALGSDVAGGRTFSIRRVMASAYDNALCMGLRVSPAALFTMATLGGAMALGLDGLTGSLEPGKEADFVITLLPPHLRTAEEVLSHLVFVTDDVRALRVFVRGRPLLT